MVNTSPPISLVLAVGIGGGMLLNIAYNLGFGTRDVINEHSFTYQGKPAAIMRVDRRLTNDLYYALINGKDRVSGTLTSDDGRVVRVTETGYSVRDANQK